MSTGAGVKGKCGISTPASWGASWAAVDTMLPFSQESLDEAIETLEDMALEGSAGKRAPDQGLISLAGGLQGDLDYANWGSMIKAAMGAESGGVYTIADDLTEIRRVEFEKSVSRWRIDSFMIEQMVISGQKGGILQISFDLLCRSLSRSATAFPSISLSTRPRVRFSNSSSNSRIRIGNLDDALGSGDETGWESFTLTLKNNLVGDDATNQARTILQPVRNGFRTVTLDVGIPRYEADTYPDWKANHTALQSDLYFTDGTNTMLFEIPEMKIASGFNANIGGPDKIAQSGQLGCYRNENNSNMSAITNEFRITIA